MGLKTILEIAHQCPDDFKRARHILEHGDVLIKELYDFFDKAIPVMMILFKGNFNSIIGMSDLSNLMGHPGPLKRKIIQEVIEGIGADAFIMINEGWTLGEMTYEEVDRFMATGKDIHDYENKKECVTITVETKFSCCVGMVMIERDEEGNFVFQPGKFKIIFDSTKDKNKGEVGAMQNLLYDGAS